MVTKGTSLLILIFVFDSVFSKNASSVLMPTNHVAKNWFAYVQKLLLTGMNKYLDTFLWNKKYFKFSFVFKRSRSLLLNMKRAIYVTTKKLLREDISFIKQSRTKVFFRAIFLDLFLIIFVRAF